MKAPRPGARGNAPLAGTARTNSGTAPSNFPPHRGLRSKMRERHQHGPAAAHTLLCPGRHSRQFTPSAFGARSGRVGLQSHRRSRSHPPHRSGFRNRSFSGSVPKEYTAVFGSSREDALDISTDHTFTVGLC